MRLALATLSKVPIPSTAERWALLGDMKELGTTTAQYHQEIGSIAAHSNLDWLITVGAAGANIARGARDGGMEEHRVFHFNTLAEAGRFVQEKLQSHDVVLIKASRAMHFELIAHELMADPLRAEELLVQCFCHYAPTHSHQRA